MAIEAVISAEPRAPLLKARNGVSAAGPVEGERKSELGQFLTPQPIGDFMAGLFEGRPREVHLLDAGAGAGALTDAFVRRLCAGGSRPRGVCVTAYELDSTLIPSLKETLARCQRQCEHVGIAFSATVHNEDFIASVVPTVRGELFAPSLPPFNAAIVNPPYRKIRSDSPARFLLRSAGIETSNLYTGFVALITRLLAPGGELVAITPRSFCNGPYFRPFREAFLETMALRRLHVFESRSAAFRGDDVLQENVIVHAVKSMPKPDTVIVSSSTGEPGSPVTEREASYREVVSPRRPRVLHPCCGGRTPDLRAQGNEPVHGFAGRLGTLALDRPCR
jgi:adenine-specific DNA-methyltransferase